ncbi:uncharacterized protein YydD (DUF2326 family) [Salinibacterium sp. CAN_S4]|uniref:ABC-three component system protein n=1 Tax=Salinibacterium sp. CAN_S4 TaxID=2787727 RepID=UPI0018EF95B6
MLESLSSNLEGFKDAVFAPGLNIAVATRTQKAEKKDSRNAVGKSSMVAVLDMLLGGDLSAKHLVRRPELHDATFQLSLGLDGATHKIERSGAAPGSPYFDSAMIDIPQLRSLLGRQLFGLVGNTDEPSYRSLISFYLRNREDGGFMDPLRTYSRQTDLSAYPALSYLLGLDTSIVAHAQELAASKRSLKALRAAARDPIFGGVVGNAAQLDAEIATLRIELEGIEINLASFQVVEDYEDRRAEADALTRTIRALNDTLALLEQRRNDLRIALEGEGLETAEYAYLTAVYEEVGIALPTVAIRPFEEVEAFHASVVRNRRTYLDTELVEVEEQLIATSLALTAADGARAEVMNLLKEGGALETFSLLQKSAAELEGRLAALRQRRASVEALSDATKHLKTKGIELEARAKSDIATRSEHIEAISAMYTQLAFEIYGKDRPAALSVQESTTGYKLLPTLGGEKSAGVASIALFCFDLTMAVTAHRAGHGPDFLVHDSHLYDSVEERQIGAALRVGAQVCREEGMQYIVTLNSDVLESALRDEPGLEFATPVTLTDAYETGGLFGMRFN